MSDWREVALGDVIELKRGYDLPKRVRADGPFPIVSSSGISGSHAEAKVRGPGVVTGRYGTLGKVFYVGSDFWPLNTSLYVRDFKGNNERFVALLLESMDLAQHDGAAAVPGLNRNQLHTVPVRVPDRGGQDKIALVVESIDHLIETNRRRVELLEEMAKAVYREWFVHFRYPGHETATFVDSPLGSIPEGWKPVPASDALEINPRVKLDKGAPHPFITMGDLSARSMLCSFSEHKAGNSGSKFRNGDTLFARITPCLENGKTAFVQCLPDEGVGRGSTEFIVLRGRRVGPAFTYCLARTDDFRGHAISSMSGASGRQRVRNECFDTFSLACPPPVIAGGFEAAVAPLFRSVHSLSLQARGLAKLRDLILPGLLTGQIDVSSLDLDAAVETAVA